jgi:hypothetical protein
MVMAKQPAKDQKAQAQAQTQPLIPVLSFRLKELSEELAGTAPTYVRSAVFDGFLLHMDGKLNGQPFSVSYPDTVVIGHVEGLDSTYMSVKLPLHGMEYYEKIGGDMGPSYAIDYTNREPEERDEARLKVFWHMHLNHPSGRVFLDSDKDLIVEDLEKLKKIGDYLRPTTLAYYQLGRSTLYDIMQSRGKGTLESLVAGK